MHMSSLFSDENWSPEGAVVLDFRDLAGTACYCSPEAERSIRQAIAHQPLNAVHWIDSGDYHYLSALWLRRLQEPARLFLFDNHPDDQQGAFGPGMLSCGSWVAEVRSNNPMVRDDAPMAYISIDLDYLSPDYARTDWDQGEASLQQLLDRLEDIRSLYGITGVDICGGITLSQGGRAEDFAVNRRTRQALQDYFTEVLRATR